jgi:hypothetical protein
VPGQIGDVVVTQKRRFCAGKLEPNTQVFESFVQVFEPNTQVGGGKWERIGKNSKKLEEARASVVCSISYVVERSQE